MLGIGLGGFVDGIVLHQILQWHNMLSNIVPPDSMDGMRANMLADGLFHAAVWVVTFAGVLMLRRAALRGPDTVPSLGMPLGDMLLGWGLFNLVEGIVDHQLLRLHNVREVAEYTAYNLVFLAVGGLLFILVGWIISRASRRSGPNARVTVS